MKRLVSIVLFSALALTLAAQQTDDQRKVTPVRPATNRTLSPPKGTKEEVIQRYLLGDSAQALAQQRKDSLSKIYHHYPTLTDVSFSLNFIEPVLMAFGQDYASTDVGATLNMWNRLQPVATLGLGWAKSMPDDMNFTYKGKPSLYFKVGANYNFLFKKSPDYQLLLGLRLGYSSFNYDITDVTYNNSYWNEHTTLSITGQKSHALWGEAGAGLKVKLWHRLSMGWMIRYQGVFSYGKNEQSRPWFIPGYGLRKKSLGVAVSISYTLPLYREPEPQANSQPKP